MDHVVYLDAKARELEQLASGAKTMIIRGAAGRKMPYGRVFEGDHLYFINNNADGHVKATAAVAKVFQSEKMSAAESSELIERNQTSLKLTEKQFKRWAGKRYIILISVKQFKSLTPFKIDRSSYSNMDDWLPVEDIKKVMHTAG